jgi:hypothetical protein
MGGCVGVINLGSFKDRSCNWICDVNDRVRFTSVHVGRVLQPFLLKTLQGGRFTNQKAQVKFAHEQELFNSVGPEG